jgi:hypothetical protein
VRPSISGIDSAFEFSGGGLSRVRREIGFPDAGDTAVTIPEVVNIGLHRHRPVSRLARSAAFNAKLPSGIGTPAAARIFSMTHSIK